jgi:peptidoglycan hydrolase FlgJ
MVAPASSALAGDARAIDALRASAARDPKAAIKEAARQFEALFMQQLMKSMREATTSSGLVDNEGTKLGTEMLDSQLALKMTGLPGGLADAIARQLERQTIGAPAVPPGKSAAAAVPLKLSSTQSDFVQRHHAAAQRAEGLTGIPATFLVAQAAHESGWGRNEIRHADGTSANNLFGIKAGAGWRGAVAEVTTTEFDGGVARKVTARFRAYASPAESFADYARLMKTGRYADVLAQAQTAEGFAGALQKAGYATDPAYADKLTRIINTTLRVQRAVA